MNQYTKDFIKVLDNIKPSKNRYEVFGDWLLMAAAALYSWKKNKSVEEEYLQSANHYTPDELKKHGQLLEITVEALEKIEQDFLGEVFTLGELTNSRTGQFFTPYNISFMMAKMAIGEKEIKQGRVIRINDPTCGAGGMLVAGAMAMKERGINYQQDAYFVGQDIDGRCARMAFIQMSLLAAPALIICGNTLTMDIHWQRETIGYHLSGMDFRLRAEALLDFISNPEIKKDNETVTPKPKRLTQGELF